MNETKPTANAARTVVSTPPLIGRRRPGRRRGGGGPRGRASGPLGGAGSSPRRPRQRSAATPTPSSAISDSSPGTSHAATSKPPPSGTASTLRAVLLDQRGLDRGLALALGDPPADELPLAVGDGGGGDVERGAALDAHHLVLDVGQRGLRLGGERRGSQQEREQQSEREPHAIQRIPLRLDSGEPRGRCPMAKTVASQATNGGSIPLARSRRPLVAGYQACGVPQCAQHGEAVTSPVQAKPHSQRVQRAVLDPAAAAGADLGDREGGRAAAGSAARRAGAWRLAPGAPADGLGLGRELHRPFYGE